MIKSQKPKYVLTSETIMQQLILQINLKLETAE